MSVYRLCFIVLFAVAFFYNTNAQDTDITRKKPMTLADPTIFLYKKTYYAYGTGNRNGFPVFTSRDLVNWKAIKENDGLAFKKGDGYGDRGFWAPQVFKYKGLFYMAYTANENIAIATSRNPYGPFKQQVKDSLPTNVKQIDPFVFIDDDGTKYLYHVRLTRGNRIFVAKLKDDFSGIVDNSLTECIASTEPWENTTKADWPVAEGPTVIKRSGKYYMLYSANDYRNPDYAVGLAVADHPLGPWMKYSGNPLLSKKQTANNGTGHGDLFKSKDGKWQYVFHVHNTDKQVSPRKTMLIDVSYSDSGFSFNQNSVVQLTIE
jgi:xylan 1,4-beta-xylosidase